MNGPIMIDAMAFLDSALVAWHVRTTVGLAAVLLAGLALRSCKARTRHRVLAWGLLAAVLLPSAAAVVPNTWGLPVGTRPQLQATNSAVTLTTTLPEPAVLEAEVTVSETSDFDVGTALLLVWMAGASACLLGVGAAAVGSLSLRRGAGPVSPATREVFEELQAHAGTSARLGLTARVHGPIVVGAFAPTILLPLQANTWSEVRLRAVLAHEFGHVAQGDHRWFPFAYAVRGLLWSNPLAWLVARSFFRAAEFSADEAAIAGSMKAPSYAAQLLSLANNGMSAPPPMLAAAALGSPDVGTRIRRLLSTPPAVAQLRRVVPVTLGLLGAWACIVFARPATVTPNETVEAAVGTSDASNLLPFPGGPTEPPCVRGGSSSPPTTARPGPKNPAPSSNATATCCRTCTHF